METLSREDLEALQLERLKEVLAWCERSKYYRKVFREEGIEPDKFRSLDDLKRIPFTDKTILREHPSTDFTCVPMGEIVRLHSTSGTTGQAIVIYYTRKDIASWAEMIARCMYMDGVRSNDVFQNMMGYGLFTGGLGFHYGAELIGALTIPAGAGNSRRQIQLMREFGTTVIHIIPSYALLLTEVFQEMGLDPRADTRLRIAFIGAEPHTEGMRRRIEEAYGIDAYNSYGLTEMNGPGVAFECPYKQGMHLWEDNYVLEVIDPSTLERVEEGEEGELVLTTLCRQGMPILRYRTRDLTRVIPGPCPCGRSHRRIDRIKGRTDDMFIIKGINIFPMQVEQVLLNVLGVGSNYQIHLERVGVRDEMKVLVEVTNELWHGDVRELRALQRHIRDELRSTILVTPTVELVEPGSLPKSEGKAVRVIDKRELI
jgi:phenylacetate-CoA ligase